MMYEGMCLCAIYMLYLDLTDSSATERVLRYLATSACGFYHFRTQCILQTLEALADFTILVLCSKREHTPHT
jgi:hypothetical protein